MEFFEAVIPYIDQKAFRESLKTMPRLLELYDLIKSNSESNRSDITKRIYGERKGAKASFSQLKFRLKDELIAFVFRHGLSFQSQDTYSRQYFSCMQSIATIKLMAQAGILSTAMEVAESTLKETVKMEFTDLSLWLCRELYIYYASNTLNAKKTKYYFNLLQEHKELQDREMKAEHYCADIRRYFKYTDVVKRKTALRLAEKYSDELQINLEKGRTSYSLILYSYLVFAMKLELANKYKELLLLCEKTINILNNRDVSRKVAIFLFDLRKIICFTELGHFHEAEKLTNKYIPIMTVGSINWFSMCMYKTLCNIRMRCYNEAYSTLVSVTESGHLKKKNRALQEIWKIIQAHISFLIAIDKIDVDKKIEFRINKFLNEVPVYSKEKRGLNISILIIQFIFLLQQRKYSQLIDREDALKLYCYRYLRRNETFRPHCFIRMLLQIPRADFNRIRTERYAEPYLKKLKSVPLKLSEQSIEVEIIPYEDLWDMTLDLLD